MSMTRRDFERVAETLKAARDSYYANGQWGHCGVVADLARDLADEFERGSLRFDKGRFLTACGVTP